MKENELKLKIFFENRVEEPTIKKPKNNVNSSHTKTTTSSLKYNK